MPIFLPPHSTRFPDPLRHRDESGLVCISAGITPEHILAAYRLGIFPWFCEGRYVYWFATHPRCVLYPERLHIGRSLAKTLKKQPYRITINRDFPAVIAACAAKTRPEQDGTWIAPEFQAAYTALHHLGHAHSFEARLPENGRLVGGFYGVQIGCVFYGESMFADAPDASKCAFALAVPYLAALGIALIDCQQESGHMRRFGAEEIPLADFQAALTRFNPQPLIKPLGGSGVCPYENH